MNVDHTAPLDPRTHVCGVLALELASQGGIERPALAQDDAAALATRLGRDLAKLVPEASGLDLCLAAAHFDPAEALRPGWPLHRRLAELHARAPGRGGDPRVIAFGAGADGSLPLPFAADERLAGGSLRILPFLLHGDAATASAVGEAFEARLLDTGMAAADTALLAQTAFGARIEHARYLTVHDLAAMVALQYEHMGLAPLWPLVETALLSPSAEAVLDAPPEPLLRYADGQARIALFSPRAWRTRYAAGIDDEARLQHAFTHFQMRQRQLAAVLDAHGIDVVFVDADAEATAADL